MMKEIGSEFWDATPLVSETEFLLSGRTALEFIIRDIKEKGDFKSVLMPSWFCDSMAEPFIRHNIEIRFYDIYFDEKVGLSAKMPKLRQNEIFYYMTYFGFNKISGLDLKDIRSFYSVIIEDTTHSYFSTFDKIGDYCFTSLRKWTGFDGISLAENKKGSFKAEKPNKTYDEYLAIKSKAKEFKADYIKNSNGDKNEFLSLYLKSEEMLEENYVGFSASFESLQQFINCDTDYIVKKRKENAQALISRIEKIPQVKLLYKAVNENETPLFVPVLIKEKRDELRKFLTSNGVYCPIHWPLSSLHFISDTAKEIYGDTLSLVCDQRYDDSDMHRIVDLIEEFFKVGE